LFATEENGGKKSAMGKNNFYKTKFFTAKRKCFRNFSSCFYGKFCEVKDTKRKKSKILFLHGKNCGKSSLVKLFALVIHTAPTVLFMQL
jgi:hypothetical protein